MPNLEPESKVQQLAHGVLQEELTKEEWARRFWPNEENPLIRYRNMAGLLNRCRSQGKYLYVIPDGDKPILKDVTRSKVNFFYVYGKIVASNTQQNELSMKMGAALIEKYPDMVARVKEIAIKHMDGVVKQAEENLNIKYVPSSNLFTKGN